MKTVRTYGLKTWLVRKVKNCILERAEKLSLKMMCGVQMVDEVSKNDLTDKFCLADSIVEIVTQGSLRWLGHVIRKARKEGIAK